jgi:hypothetical protein
MIRTFNRLLPAFALLLVLGCASRENPRIVPVAPGWARNSINATIIRNQAIVTHGNLQYTAFYDADANMVLAKRRLDSTDWEIQKTEHKGNVRDAHNGITLGIDGCGILHVCWDHHNHPLRYARTVAPGSLELTDKLSMTSQNETRVCYPEFYHLPDGDLIFMYRHGRAGGGNTLLNRYDVQTDKWSIVQHPLIDGQDERNAYPNQIAIDSGGVWHLSWNWREQGGVQTNHDLCYARSPDEGKTWYRSDGQRYTLPITQDTAEIICAIPQNSELINHTTMTVDNNDHPMIATYWRPTGTNVPQFHLVRHDGNDWHVNQITKRTTPFRLSGGGTKRIPISRPKLIVDRQNNAYMVFRDTERRDVCSVAISNDSKRENWRIIDLTKNSLDRWEPNYDPILWRRDNVLHIFAQRVGQGDAEALEELAPQMVNIIEWTP